MQSIKVFLNIFYYQQQLLLLLSRFSRVRLCATPETAAHQAPPPWDSPGKSTGVGCHCLLQCMKVKQKSLSHVRLTLRDPVDCSLPGSSVHGIVQSTGVGCRLPSFIFYKLIQKQYYVFGFFYSYQTFLHLLFFQ